MDAFQRQRELHSRFINGEEIDPSEIRSEIFESWKRSKKTVDPYMKRNTELLAEEDFKRLRLKYKEIIEITVPVMQNLYDMINDGGIEIGLVAAEKENNYILEIIGDELALRQSKYINCIPGSNWAEHITGTSASTVALFEDKPFQIYPFENFVCLLKDNTQAAAPIHDPETREIIGALTIAGNFKLVHPHTLGMTVALVNLIEKQIMTTRVQKKAEIENSYKTLLIESAAIGLIAIDSKMMVTHINKKAMQTFGFSKDIVGYNIISALSEVFETFKSTKRFSDVLMCDDCVTDELINISSKSGTIRCAISIRCIDLNEQRIGKVITVQEMSRLDTMIARTIGNNARVTFNDLIGINEQFLRCIENAIKVSDSRSSILLLGESGTGKDLFAQSIHNASTRSNQPYFAINCAAIPHELIGSELFGYVEGAFTGAKKNGNPGKFELANGGTLFLDEIGDMPLDMQTSLLRVLEEKAITRIGGQASIPIDVRIIAATNKNLKIEFEKGNFREDLYYRLNVISIDIPPLRKRRTDIPLLIDHMIKTTSARLGKLPVNADTSYVLACTLYDWPGNVRELQNVIERSINLSNRKLLTTDLLPEHITKNNNEIDNLHEANLKQYSKTIESEIIKACIKKYANVRKAAKELGISKSTLYRKLNQE
ncbi:sigma-54-dependent Fis family transcriptional regulator [Desulfosporosinus shakirovi]|uniref:sigma-54-dependent Fis family transcriptional regulator n=1 Tax=Desulfosporosinus shakirovi TaxID=2885154 RepID=UPI001E5EAA13|nr:sigma 54-interacting transcriptional regulator [Desulfosporosinus sp. SRJS8]MCB8817854.1 sigma 54-interacting transcriptional regulator [Desulfosporosinus sp. SRJS8]